MNVVRENEELGVDLDLLKERIASWKMHKSKAYAEEMWCLDMLKRKKKQLEEIRPNLDRGSEEQMTLFEKNKQRIHLLKQSSPRTPNFMLRAALGSVPFTLSDSSKVQYKTEYERYKLTMTLLNLVLSALNFLLFNNHCVDSLLYLLVAYYYLIITLREHILRLNGSRIHGWWLTHHYLCIALAGTLILWPSDWSECPFRIQFLAFFIYTAALQYFQYSYQMARLYKLRSLSRAGPMDVTADLPQPHIRMNLGFLLPFLFLGQMFQLYNSYSLMQYWRDQGVGQWQVLTASLLFLLIGIGNLCMTVRVSCRKLRASTSRCCVDQASPPVVD